MASYYVSAAGSNTSPYDTWAKAATAFGTAVAAAAGGDDIILVDNGHTEELADTTYTFTSGTRVYCVDKDNSDALSTMGAAAWIGNSTTNAYTRLAGNDAKVFIYGLTFRTHGVTVDSIATSFSAGSHFVLENCLLWHSGTATGTVFLINGAATGYSELIGCEFRFGASGQYMDFAGHSRLVGCTFAANGTVPATRLIVGNATSGGAASFIGCDFSAITNTLVGNTSAPCSFTFDRCKLGSGVTPQAAQTLNQTKASAQSLFTDCHSGDTHMEFAYYDGLGEVTKNGTIYFTSGAAAASWKVVTNANTTPNVPFTTPWIDLYNTGTSAVTPRFEILRDGSATAYQNDEVWAEFTAKTTANVTLATAYNDRVAVAGTPANQDAGAGTGSWTGENATAWSGKCDSGAAITPTEVGYIRGRICVAEPSITVYVNPEILTA